MTYQRATAVTLLTASQERELAQAVEAGREAEERIAADLGLPGDPSLVKEGRRARRHFIEANLRLVFSIAAKTRVPPHVDRQDVVQDGMLGLDRAVTKFDWRRGHRFSTYATWWIRQAIQGGLEHSRSVVRIPSRTNAELTSSVDDSGELPTSDRLVAAAVMTNIDSLDRTVGEHYDTTLAELVPSPGPGPDDEAELSELRRSIQELVQHLDPQSAEVVIARYGLDGREPETLVAIAERCGVSAEAVRRRLVRALETLRPRAAWMSTASPADAVAALAA